MNYKKFFAEVADWVVEANHQAGRLGMESDAFWKWVTTSAGELSNRYHNNQLVIDQMMMLCDWLEKVYKATKKR